MYRGLHDFAVARLAGSAQENDDFALQQRLLSQFNRSRLEPGLGVPPTEGTLLREQAMLSLENEFVSRTRSLITPWIDAVPDEPLAFISWFENLRASGPGQGDPLFPYLAEQGTLDQMRWFLAQEVAGEAGFDDLVAMTQVKMPTRPKLEMARNYWDEMGRGDPKGMHGPMLDRLAEGLNIHPTIETTVPEALALGNMMMALASNRSLAFHSVGALGVIEMTAPERATYVTRGLNRLDVPKKQSHYFALHSVLDIKHSQAWNLEVLEPLVREDGRRAKAIAEGAILRLWCGEQCFKRYRQELDIAACHIRLN